MSGFETFAVAGAGALGSFIAKELLELKHRGRISEVRILTRSHPGKHYDLAEKGATIVTVNYTSQYSLVSALVGVDVLVSTVGYEAFTLQSGLADAAKLANVQLFVPSEFGFATAGKEERDIPPLFRAKEAIRRKLLSIGLPYAVFYTGPFPDYVFTLPWFAQGLGLDFFNNKFVLAGAGTGLVSFTGRKDVSRYLAYVLTSLPREQLRWKVFRIEGDRTSFAALLSEYQLRIGKSIEVTQRPISDVEVAHMSNSGDLFSTILLVAECGIGAVGKPGELDNDLFPNWSPSKAIDLIMEGL